MWSISEDHITKETSDMKELLKQIIKNIEIITIMIMK